MDWQKQRTILVIAVIVLGVVGAVAVYWIVKEEPLQGPAPPPQAPGITVEEFSCNGQDVLAGSVKAKRSSPITVHARAVLSEATIGIFAERPICTFFIVDEHQIICQSQVVDWNLKGSVLSMTCATTSTTITGLLTLRIVATHPTNGHQVTVCEGKLTITN